MLSVCKRLFPARIVDNPRDGVDLVTVTLSEWRNSWLLVFDNLDKFDDIPDIVQFFPDSSRGRILITSRFERIFLNGNYVRWILKRSMKDEKELS